MGDGYYCVIAKHSLKVLDVNGGGLTTGEGVFTSGKLPAAALLFRNHIGFANRVLDNIDLHPAWSGRQTRR